MKKLLTILAAAWTVAACASQGQQAPTPPPVPQAAAPAPAPAPPGPPVMVLDPSLPVSSQVELLRSDIRLMKKEIVAQAMDLTEAEAAAFWPVYNDYQAARARIFDRRLEMVRAYAASFSEMTDAEATRITHAEFLLDSDILKLQQATFQKLTKATSAQTAARWVQIDRQLEALFTLQIAQHLPLMPRPVAAGR